MNKLLLLVISLKMINCWLSDGIFGTPLTWAILQEDLQKSLNATATLGPTTTAHPIGDGAGFISKLALITFEWISQDPNDLQSLPKQAIIKIIQQDLNLENSTEPSLESLMNDTELRFFEANKTNKTELGLPKNLRVPGFYCGRKFGENGINMGYLAEEYVVGEMLQIYQEVPDDGVLQVLDQLVQLAATSLKNPDILKVWDNAAMNALLAQGRTIAKIDGRLNTMKDLYPKLTSQIDKMLAKTNLIFGDFKRFMDLRKSTSDRQVLCHGDMWTPNVLWQRNVNGSVDLAAILDWQLLNVGSPTEDLVYFLHSALSPETYPKKKNDYLHYYYDNLKQSVTNLPMPWSNLENFIQQYEVSYTYCIMVLMPWYTTAKEQLLGTYINNPSFVDAFDEKIKFMTNETIRCINKWF